MKIDYLIIGAGMAGLVLRRFLAGERAVLVDPNPGGYKIGESIVPELFAHPVLRELVPKVRALPSFTPKFGTTFVSADSVASFPLPPSEIDYSMHVGRSELEALMAREWSVEIAREKVVSIDIERKIVRTDKQVYEVEKQIIDSSGPAMVLASALGEVSSLWPVYAAWGYFDVVENHDERFWASIRETGRRYLRYDAPRRRIIPGTEIAGWSPSRTTLLTKLRDGVWTWQIPLFDSKLLSFGVVSRHGRVSEEELLATVRDTHSPNYTLERHKRADEGGPASPFERTYAREGFARRARVAATMDYILLADAFAFADPVYSVGAALAVNRAILLAGMLSDGIGFTEARRDAWCADSEELLGRAVRAFEFWYSGAVLRDDAAAAEVLEDFLVGDAFQVELTRSYGMMVRDVAQGGTWPRPGMPDTHSIEWADDSLRDEAAGLLGIDIDASDGVDASGALYGWKLLGAGRHPSGFKLRFENGVLPELTVVVECDDPSAKSYKRVGALSLSYLSLKDAPYPFDASVASLLNMVADRMGRRQADWLALRKQG